MLDSSFHPETSADPGFGQLAEPFDFHARLGHPAGGRDGPSSHRCLLAERLALQILLHRRAALEANLGVEVKPSATMTGTRRFTPSSSSYV